MYASERKVSNFKIANLYFDEFLLKPVVFKIFFGLAHFFLFQRFLVVDILLKMKKVFSIKIMKKVKIYLSSPSPP